MLKIEVLQFLDTTGMSKDRFAKAVGVNSSTLNLWLNRGCELSEANIEKVKHGLLTEQQKIKDYVNTLN